MQKKSKGGSAEPPVMAQPLSETLVPLVLRFYHLQPVDSTCWLKMGTQDADIVSLSQSDKKTVRDKEGFIASL